MQNFALSKLAASAALIGLCLVASANAGSLFGTYHETSGSSGMSGIDAYSKGDYKAARDTFASENQQDPNDLYAQFNLADAYNALGDKDRAVGLYRQVAANGRNTHPQHIFESPNSDPTFTEAACRHLKDLSVQDSNCAN